MDRKTFTNALIKIACLPLLPLLLWWDYEDKKERERRYKMPLQRGCGYSKRNYN